METNNIERIKDKDGNEHELTPAKHIHEISHINSLQEVLDQKQNELTPGENITIENDIISADSYDDTEIQNQIEALQNQKQDKLISGTNIKTINNESILGSGNITITSTILDSDLDTQTDSGIYLVQQDLRPTIGDRINGILIVQSGSSIDVIRQILITNDRYSIRSKARLSIHASWSDWEHHIYSIEGHTHSEIVYDSDIIIGVDNDGKIEINSDGVKGTAIDSTPTANSDNLVTSGGVKSALDSKASSDDFQGLENIVQGLEDSKADVDHTHVKSDITDLDIVRNYDYQSDDEVPEEGYEIHTIYNDNRGSAIFLHVKPSSQSGSFEQLDNLFYYEGEDPGPQGYIHYHQNASTLKREYYMLKVHKFIPDTATKEHFFVEVLGAWS